jgi:hypothetical protein
MRISEQRYARDRRALDVAARLIDFEARTGTIRELTGLADGSIRSLSKACGEGQSLPRLRHRGASPRRVNTLLGKVRLKNEAAALLGLCQLMGITQPQEPSSDRALTRVARAERLCDAFWTFRYLLPEASISFEHMLLLLSEAARGEDLATAHCPDCAALLVVDPLSLLKSRCTHCTELAADWHNPEAFTQYRKVAEDLSAYR